MLRQTENREPSQPEMGELILRPARAEDDAAIGELLVRAFVETYGKKLPEVVVPDSRKRDLRDVATKRLEATVIVLEVFGKVIGTAMLFPPGHPHSRAWTKGTADLRYVAVLPEYQGRGLASPLVLEIEKIARQKGFAAICLHVRREATGVAGLYERHGYLRKPEGDTDQLPEVYLHAYLKQL